MFFECPMAKNIVTQEQVTPEVPTERFGFNLTFHYILFILKEHIISFAMLNNIIPVTMSCFENNNPVNAVPLLFNPINYCEDLSIRLLM